MKALIQGMELEVLSFSLDFKDVKIPEFKLKIPAYPFDNPDSLIYQDIVILRDGVEFISGIIAQLPRPEQHEGIGGYLQLVCDNQLGRLYVEEAFSVQFQNATIAVALNTLLNATEDSGWLLNDTSTLEDADITIDVRNKETMWSQLEAIRKAAKNPYFLRYAGKSGDNYLLDVGSFGERVRNVFAIQGQNVIGEAKYSQPSNDPLKSIRPISGKVGNSPVALSEALILEPALASDPDYPLNASAERVESNVISSGRRVRRPYTEIKTENQRLPNQTQRSQAALALYYRARRELMASIPYKIVRLDIGSDVMPSIFTKIYVDVVAREFVYDPYTETETLYELMPIQGWFKITGFSLKGELMKGSVDETGELRKQDVYTLELSTGIQEESYSEFELMYRTVEKNDLEDNSGLVVGVLSQVSVTVQWTGVAADCNYSGANTGKIFEFPLPAIPHNATGIFAEVKEVSDDTVAWNILQDESLLLPLQLCVHGPGGMAWTNLDDVSITVWYSFI